MGKSVRNIPSFDEVMNEPKKAIPSFDQVMGEEKKKETSGVGPSPSTAPISPSKSPYELPAVNDGSFIFGLGQTGQGNPDDIKKYNETFEQVTGYVEPTFVSPQPLTEKEKYARNKQREQDIVSVQNKVYAGTVTPNDLSKLYNTPYGKNIAKGLIQTYSPELGQQGFDADVKWAEVAKKINQKNRTNSVIAEESYQNGLGKEIEQISNFQSARLEAGDAGGRAGGSTIFKESLPIVDINNSATFSPAIEQLKSSSYVIGSDGKADYNKRRELLSALENRLFYLKSKEGIDPEVMGLSESINDAVSRVNMRRERGENIESKDFAKNDAENSEHFKLGLSLIKESQPSLYANVINAIQEKKKISDTDYRNIATVGQAMMNQQKFRGAAENPELIDSETDFDYTTETDKKAEYARIIGERAKSAGLTNVREFSEDQIKRLAYDLPNKTIVQDLANEEKILGYDAIPKSGGREALVQGILQPISGISNTIDAVTESPAETYLRSKRLDVGIGGQKVADEKGQVSSILPSDRGNIYYDAMRGFGQFIPQVLLTRGIGGTINKIAGTTGTAAAAPVTNYGGTAISTYLQTYGDAYSDALQKTGDADTARLIGAIDGISSAAFELILPDTKIADAAVGGLRGLKQTLANDLVDLVKKGGDAAQLASKGRGLVEKFVKSAINTTGQEVAEEVGTQITDYVTESIFSPTTAKDRNLADEVWETAKATAVSMAIPAILGGAGQGLSQDFTRSAFNSAAINFNEYKNALQEQLDKGEMSQDEYNGAVKLLSTHRQSIDASPKQNINGQQLDGQQQLDYAYEDTKIKVYKEKIANTDGVAKEMWERKIKEAEDIQREIVMPTTGQTAPAPIIQEQERSKEITSAPEITFPSRNDDFVRNRKYFSEEQESNYNQLVSQGREQEAAQMITDRKAEIVSEAQRIGRVGNISPVLNSINNADYINEKELDTAADELYTALDEVEKSTEYSPAQKESAQNLIESLINKIEGYEFRTSTQNRQVAETTATQIAKPSRKTEAKSPIEIATGSAISITTPDGNTSEGNLELIDGNYVITSLDGTQTVIGEKAITDRDITIPDVDEYDPIEFDENGTVKSVTLEDRNGNRIKINDPEKALDAAIRIRASAIGEVSPEEFDTVYEIVVREIPEEVIVSTGLQVPSRDAETITIETTSGEKPLNTNASPVQETENKSNTPKNKTKRQEKVTSLTNELRTLLGEKGLPLSLSFNSDIQDLFNSNNSTEYIVTKLGDIINDEFLNDQVKTLLPYLRENPEIKFNKLFSIGSGEAHYTGDWTVLLSYIKSNKKLAETVIHELYHIISMNELLNNKKFEDYIQNLMINVRSDLGLSSDYFTNVQNVDFGNTKDRRYYGLLNPKEFIAEIFSNKDFSDMIDSTKKETFLDRIISFINRIIGRDNKEKSQKIRESILNGLSTKIQFMNDDISLEVLRNYKNAAKESDYKYSPNITEKSLPLTGNTSPLSAISFEDMAIVEGDTIEQAVDKAIDYGGPFTDVFKAIKADANFKNIQLEILPSKGGNTSEGLYHPTGEGAITPYKLQLYNQGNTQYALAHELMHFFTLDSAVAEQVKDSKSSKALEGFYNYIVANKGKPVTGLATLENYGLTNFKEFMAELLINPTFRNAASDVYANNYDEIAKTDKFVRDQKGGSIIDIIRDLFRDLINAVIGNKSTVDFNPSESVVDQAAKLMTDLFFGGQDVISSQTPGQTGAIVGRVTDGEGPLAIGGVSREEAIRSFVESKLAEGEDREDVRQSLIEYGIPESELNKYFPNNKSTSKSDEKSVLNRINTSTEVSDSVKEKIQESGLKYKVRSQQEARSFAKNIIKEFGIDDAVTMAESGRFHGDVNSMIFAESLDYLYNEEQTAQTPESKQESAERYADIALRYQDVAESGGRFISAIADFYKKSPAGLIIKVQKEFDRRTDEYFKGREKPTREAWQDFLDTVEGKELLEEEINRRSEGKPKEKKPVFAPDAERKVKSFFKNLKIDTKRNTGSYLLPPQIYNAAIDIIEKSVLAGLTIGRAIDAAIDYIGENYTQAWNVKDFKSDIRKGFKAQNVKPILTDEQKQRVLKKWERKLVGLKDEEKQALLNKSFIELMDKGALNLDSFKRLYAEAAGLPHMTPELEQKLKDLANALNKPNELKEEILSSQTTDKVNEYKKSVQDAERASRELNDLIATEKRWYNTFLTVMRLNLLGSVSLMGNVVGNVTNLPFRYFSSLAATGVNYLVAGAQLTSDKLFGTSLYKVSPSHNSFKIQQVYFRGQKVGWGEGAAQVIKGVSNKDLYKREIKQNIRPFTSIKKLVNSMTGKERLDLNGKINAFIEGFPTLGMSAEVIARALNLGDRGFRYGAEMAEAERLAKKKGLTGKQKELFILFPDEESQTQIEQAGATAVFQQDNILADALDKVVNAVGAKKDDPVWQKAIGLGVKAGFYTTQPFLKTPLNVFVEFAHYAIPAIPLTRAAIAMVKKDGDRASYHLGQAIVGFSSLLAAGSLVSNGLIVPAGDGDEEAKQRQGIAAFQRRGQINISGLKRFLAGSYDGVEDEDVWVDLRYMGFMGMLLLAKADQYKDATPEEIKQQTLLQDMVGMMGSPVKSALTQGVFGGTMSLLNATSMGGGYMDNWLLGNMEVFTNAFNPKWLRDFGIANNDYMRDTKGMSLSESAINRLKNNYSYLGNSGLPAKVNIWGDKVETIPHGENSYLYTYFGILKPNSLDNDKFGFKLYDYYNQTKDYNIFPPATKREINGHKLTGKQFEEYSILLGSHRKQIVAAYLDGDFESDKSEGKEVVIKRLGKLYGFARKIATNEFKELYPELQIKKSNEEQED